MLEDKDFKELLLKGGLEKASPDFTRNVMVQIEQLNTSKSFNSSLISEKWKRIYRFTFIIVTLLVITLSFAIKPAEIPAINIKAPAFTIVDLYQVLIYIVTFWALVFVSMQMNNRDENLLR